MQPPAAAEVDALKPGAMLLTTRGYKTWVFSHEDEKSTKARITRASGRRSTSIGKESLPNPPPGVSPRGSVIPPPLIMCCGRGKTRNGNPALLPKHSRTGSV